MTNAFVLQDSTDHIGFHCPICLSIMNVSKVITPPKKHIDADGIDLGRCTYIYLKCKCGNNTMLKFYWKEDGKYMRLIGGMKF